MPKVSVIMPSLNVAPYIKECMDSVIGQTLADMEIICVDAGSTDGTLDILREYCKGDNRIHLIISNEKSYGHQMNLGIEKASGEYIGIVETDDYIMPKMFEDLYEKASEWNADFVKSDFDVFATMPNGERLFLKYSLKRYCGIEYDNPISYKEYVSGAKTVDIFTWNGIYKKSFLEKNHIVFQETPGAAFQDCGFRYQVALWAKCGIFVNKSYYRYRRDNTGSSMYNRKAVQFNFSECNYLLSIAYKNKLDRERFCFLAREIIFIATSPYVDLLSWSEPAEGSEEALNGFRKIISHFIDEKYLDNKSKLWCSWLELKIFIEDPDCFRRYAILKNKLKREQDLMLLDTVIKHKDVIIFGSGYAGSCAYCRLRVNNIDHIAAFCDNNVSKWNTTYMEKPVFSPSYAVQNYRDACYVIANLGHSEEMRTQLLSYGVGDAQIVIYESSTFPIDCTNICKNVGRN